MPSPPRDGESKSAFVSRCVRYLVKEGKSQDQALGQCYGMWRQKHGGDKPTGKSFAELVEAINTRKDSVQAAHVATAIGNSQDRKRRNFDAVVSEQSQYSEAKKPNYSLDTDPDDGEQDMVRGVKPSGKYKLFYDCSPYGTGCTPADDDRYDTAFESRAEGDNADADESDRDLDDEIESRAEEDDDDAEDRRKGGWRIPFDIKKTDVDQQLIFGWASTAIIDGKYVIDKQEDIIPIEELERAAMEYTLYSRDGGDMHSKRGVSKLVESMVFTPEKEKLGVVAKDEKGRTVHGWWVGFHVHDDELWKAVKAGKRPEFSIGGQAIPVEVGKVRGRRYPRVPF